MYKYKTIIILLIAICFFGSCDDQLLVEEFKGGDWFYLENKEALMPVWVRGNKSSKVFIIYLHGGPGDTAMDTAGYSNAFHAIEKDFAVVYYDQRCSATAQGNAKPESFTVAQFVEDLDKLTAVINQKYNNPQLFLYGHSWGGALGTAYLIDSKRQSKIRGWIECDGGHNLKDGWILSQEWVKERATIKINNGDNASYWQNEIEWYNTDPAIGYDYFNRHGENLNKLNGYFLDRSKLNAKYPLASPQPIMPLNGVYLQINNNFDLKNIDFTAQMQNITLPTLILWGKHDGCLPVDLAQIAYDNLGTSASDKSMYFFDQSAHSPHWEEPELFVAKVKEFVEKYK